MSVNYDAMNNRAMLALHAYCKNHNASFILEISEFDGLFFTSEQAFSDEFKKWFDGEGVKDPLEKEYRNRYTQLCLLRHVSGDWGLSTDILTNELRLQNKENVVSSSFLYDGVTVIIISTLLEEHRSIIEIEFLG